MDKFAGGNADLGDLRIVTWCLIGYAGFLRFSELASLKESDLHIFSGLMEFLLSRVKPTNTGMEHGS